MGKGKGDLNDLRIACEDGDLEKVKVLIYDDYGKLINPLGCLIRPWQRMELGIAQYLSRHVPSTLVKG